MPVLSTMRSVATAMIMFFGISQAGYSPQSKSNVVVYWGQGPYQLPLGHFCQQDSIDVVVLSFVNNFSSESFSFDFGNACGGSTCPQIASDIQICQSNGKKILLSMGGNVAAYSINGFAEGEAVADMIYGAFGPSSSSHNSPRPFGNVAIDGIDFDIEAPSADSQVGFIAMANKFRSLSAGGWLIAGAPQAIIPDANIGNMIQEVQFDMLFVQFYNTPGVSARDWVDGKDLPYDKFTESIANGASSGAKVYIGLPGGPNAANPGFYLEQDEAGRLIGEFAQRQNLGGVMLWEATHSENNGKYHQFIKNALSYSAEEPEFRVTLEELKSPEVTTADLLTLARPLCIRDEHCSSAPVENMMISVIAPATTVTTSITVTGTQTEAILSDNAPDAVEQAISTVSRDESSTAFDVSVEATSTAEPTSYSSEASGSEDRNYGSVGFALASPTLTIPSVGVFEETLIVANPSNKTGNLSSPAVIVPMKSPFSKAAHTIAGTGLIAFGMALAFWA